MKSAEEILKEIYAELSAPNPSDWKTFDEIMEDGTGDAAIKAMKLYAEQAIDECAEQATTKSEWQDLMSESHYLEVVDKQSILNVKNNLK